VSGLYCGGWCGWDLVGVRFVALCVTSRECVTYNHVKDDDGFCCHLFVQLNEKDICARYLDVTTVAGNLGDNNRNCQHLWIQRD
jgi:hypothetical protein